MNQTSICFLIAQLQEIYSTTLASIICRNSDDVSESQPFVMRKTGGDNVIKPCSEIDTFSFRPWKPNSAHYHFAGAIKIPSEEGTVKIFNKNANKTTEN